MAKRSKQTLIATTGIVLATAMFSLFAFSSSMHSTSYKGEDEGCTRPRPKLAGLRECDGGCVNKDDGGIWRVAITTDSEGSTKGPKRPTEPKKPRLAYKGDDSCTRPHKDCSGVKRPRAKVAVNGDDGGCTPHGGGTLAVNGNDGGCTPIGKGKHSAQNSDAGCQPGRPV